MGSSVSQAFRSSALLTHRDGKVSEATAEKLQIVFEILQTNPKVSIHTLDYLLTQITKHENILAVHDDAGYNILQRAIGLNQVDLVKWLLNRHNLDVNRSPCSLPLHIACVRGNETLTELLLKHGARVDTEARMCFPNAHSPNCEERGKYGKLMSQGEPTTTKLQNALAFAIDGDHFGVLNILTQKIDEPWPWIPFRAKKPLLHLACERGAWKCVQQLVVIRSDEINLIKDEYYPIHRSILHDLRFVELLIANGAETTVRTCTQQMSLLHVVLLHARKSADDVLQTLRVLLERGGCKELINAPDSLGNTPLHALIVRYALEEAKYGYEKWNKWDVLHLVRFLLQNGAKSSINQQGNSALACVFRHIRDWDVCFDIASMLLKEDADPNVVGRDGSVPIMVCLVHMINKDPLHHFTHTMKVCYLNCIRILLQHGANPNEQYRTLTPLHVLIFTVSENFTLICDLQKRNNFAFIKNILLLLLGAGLDVNQSSELILQSCIDMVPNMRTCTDMLCLFELVLTLVQYGANVNAACGKYGCSDGLGMAPTTTYHQNYNSSSRSSSHLVEQEEGAIGSSISTGGGGGAAVEGNVAGFNSGGGTDSSTVGSPIPLVTRNSFKNSKNNLLFYFLMLISKKPFILLDEERTYLRIVQLFHMTMDHGELYRCLGKLNNIYLAQVPNKTQNYLVAHVARAYQEPRTLKQSCRYAIYKVLNRKVAQNINQLSLPPLLKDYMMNFE